MISCRSDILKRFTFDPLEYIVIFDVSPAAKVVSYITTRPYDRSVAWTYNVGEQVEYFNSLIIPILKDDYGFVMGEDGRWTTNTDQITVLLGDLKNALKRRINNRLIAVDDGIHQVSSGKFGIKVELK